MEKSIEEVRVVFAKMMSTNLMMMAVYSISPDHEIATRGANIGKERWERAAYVATFEGQLNHALLRCPNI